MFDIAYVSSSSSQMDDDGESSNGSAFGALADQNKTPIGAVFQADPKTGLTSDNPENVGQNTDGTKTGNSLADYHPFGFAYGTNPSFEGLDYNWGRAAFAGRGSRMRFRHCRAM